MDKIMALYFDTIYILKGYIDSYSDLNRNLQIGPYFFKIATVATAKITNIYYIYQLNVIIRSDRVVKKMHQTSVNFFLLSDMSFSRDQNSKWQPKNINNIQSKAFETHNDRVGLI